MKDMVWIALTANGNSFAENALEALNVTLVGMVTIFAVLALLWGIIELLHRILSSGKALAKEGKAGKAEPPVSPAPTAPAASPAAQTGDDGALIAAITAAVSAAMAEEGYTGGFRVVSFRRVPPRGQGRF